MVNDFEEAGQTNLKRLSYIEFLEFLARLAFLKFRGSEYETLQLNEKLEHLLD